MGKNPRLTKHASVDSPAKKNVRQNNGQHERMDTVQALSAAYRLERVCERLAQSAL